MTERERAHFVKHFLMGKSSFDLRMSVFLLEHVGFYYQRSSGLVNHRENTS